MKPRSPTVTLLLSWWLFTEQKLVTIRAHIFGTIKKDDGTEGELPVALKNFF